MCYLLKKVLKAELTNEDLIYEVLFFLFFGIISITLVALSIKLLLVNQNLFVKYQVMVVVAVEMMEAQAKLNFICHRYNLLFLNVVVVKEECCKTLVFLSLLNLRSKSLSSVLGFNLLYLRSNSFSNF